MKLSPLTPWWRLSRGTINPSALGLKCFVFCLSLVLFFPDRALIAGEVQTISRERHWAVTGEKFELALVRTRAGKKARRRFPVILSHGLFTNSLLFDLDESRSLARFLAREGFDVWNLSLRGTGRSLNPLKGGPASWTLDDMIEKDIPAVLRYVRKESGSPRLFWLGYETGGLLLYGYVERKGDAGLAGLATVGASAAFNLPQQRPLRKLLQLEGRETLKKLVLSLNAPFFGRALLPLVPKIEELFYNPENIDDDVKARFLEDGLARVNPGVLDQLLLMIRRGEFVSASGNFSYRRNLARIQLPVLLIGGERDRLAPPEAIQAVYRTVGSADRSIRVFGPRSKDATGYGHIDLILGKKAESEVFPVIGRWLGQRDGREQ